MSCGVCDGTGCPYCGCYVRQSEPAPQQPTSKKSERTPEDTPAVGAAHDPFALPFEDTGHIPLPPASTPSLPKDVREMVDRIHLWDATFGDGYSVADMLERMARNAAEWRQIAEDNMADYNEYKEKVRTRAALTRELSECRNQYIGLEGMYGLLQQERDIHQRSCETLVEANKYLNDQLAALTKDWNLLVEDRDALTAELAASQARGAKLREALDLAMQVCDVVPNRLHRHEDSHIAVIGQLVNNGSMPDETSCFDYYRHIREALALPKDTSALDARLAEERERMIHACEESGYFGAASIIRGMK